VGEQRPKPGEAVLPALTTGGAQGVEVRVPVMGMGVSLTRGGAKKVKVDAVHDLRPV
jgi:hypothetical protein